MICLLKNTKHCQQFCLGMIRWNLNDTMIRWHLDDTMISRWCDDISMIRWHLDDTMTSRWYDDISMIRWYDEILMIRWNLFFLRVSLDTNALWCSNSKPYWACACDMISQSGWKTLCTCFYLKLDQIYISGRNFDPINWLCIYKRLEQCMK